MKTDLQQKLKSQVKIDPETSCWNWQRTKTPKGYGRIGDSYAHRVSYETFIGPIPKRLCVCHRCDNPSCINPAHLFVGTHKDNMQDCVQKNRISRKGGRRGEAHHSAKLSVEKVEAIFTAYSNGQPVAEIAQSLGLKPSSIYKVLKRKSWKALNLEAPPISAFRSDGTQKLSRLTASEVASLKADRQAGLTYAQLGAKWRIGAPTAYKICAGLRYKELVDTSQSFK